MTAPSAREARDTAKIRLAVARVGLAEGIKDKIERDLDALVDAEIADVPNRGQVYTWPRPAA